MLRFALLCFAVQIKPAQTNQITRRKSKEEKRPTQCSRRSTIIAHQFTPHQETDVTAVWYSSCCSRAFQLRPPGRPAAAGHFSYNMWVLQLRPLGAPATAVGRFGGTRWVHQLRPLGSCGGWAHRLQLSVDPAAACGRSGRSRPMTDTMLKGGGNTGVGKTVNAARRYHVPSFEPLIRISTYKQRSGRRWSTQPQQLELPTVKAVAPKGRSWIDRHLLTGAANHRSRQTAAADAPNGCSLSAQRQQRERPKAAAVAHTCCS